MILRFSAAATLSDRAHVERVLRANGTRAVPSEGGLLLRNTLTREQIVTLAALPGVEGIAPGGRTYSTLRVLALGWTSAACGVLGLLIIIAANFPAPLGTPADPLRTPADLQSSWPLLPLHALVEHGPDWLPVSVLPALVLTLLVGWPLIGGGLAAKSPRVHNAIGAAVILTAAALAMFEVMR
jgi:hypothetical protein